MAKSKGGGGKSRGSSRPSYPANKPSKTGGKSGSGRSNAPAKHERILQQPELRNSLARYFIAQERRKGNSSFYAFLSRGEDC